MLTSKAIQVDYVVVGAGVAGLRAAIELGQTGSVLVLAKSELTESATELAQGGIAAALSDEDEISLHEADTLNAGAGLCNPAAVKLLVEEGPRYIQELIEWGTQFDRAGTKLAFTREGAHSRSRVLHAQGDSTGHEISRALFARARTLETIQFQAHALTLELITQHSKVTGLKFLDEDRSQVQEVRAGAVMLATGGLGQVYTETTNPSVATGDGMAIAFEAGAVLSDMEFVQFHPTALAVKGAPRFLLSEALRGEGGVLRNYDLERFMKRHHEAGDLAPRDIVARAIVAEMQQTKTDYVYLDMTRLKSEFLRKRFPRIYNTCLSFGMDISSDMIPVRPAAHYAMGGVKTDLDGRTNLTGLYAAGETAATGVHGANRLASNSLLEGLVYGARAGKAMAQDFPTARRRASKGNHREAGSKAAEAEGARLRRNNTAATANSTAVLEEIRAILSQHAGILRDGRELAQAAERLRNIPIERPAQPSRAGSELFNVWTVARLIACSALAREESRGSHYRADFPYRDDERFCKHSLVQHGTQIRFE